jgi:perosamine synthetase
MSLFSKQIFTGFMPQLHTEDVFSAFVSVLPGKRSSLHIGDALNNVETQLKKYFHLNSATCFDSGRSALFVALQAFNIKEGDEVIVQAFTCAVVSNAIIWTGAKPVYVDIDDTYSANPNDIAQKITNKTKAIILQHTFGIPAHIERVLQLAKKHDIAVIEDCAHVLGGTYNGQLLGTFGDIAMLSFGSEKPISCGRGGALITNNEILSKKIKDIEQSLRFAPDKVIQKQLMTFIYFWIYKPLYQFGIGKFALAFLKKFHFLSRIIEKQEKNGKNLPFYPSKFSNALAKIVLLQLSKLDFMNERRIHWGKKYEMALREYGVTSIHTPSDPIPYLRFPLRIQNPKKLLLFAKKRGVLLGDWYSSPIAPIEVDQACMGYTPKSCIHAEKTAQESVNLPTHDSLTDFEVNKIIEIVSTYVRQNR